MGHRPLRRQELAGRGREQEEPKATGPRANPFNAPESDRPGASVVTDILEVSPEEAEGAGRIVLAKDQRQPTTLYVRAAAMKSILPAVLRKEEGKGGQGRPGTGVTGHVGTGGRTGGQGRQGTGGREQVGTAGARRTTGHQGGIGGKGGRQGQQWPLPWQSFQAVI